MRFVELADFLRNSEITVVLLADQLIHWNRQWFYQNL
jgi:hypothetical protein